MTEQAISIISVQPTRADQHTLPTNYDVKFTYGKENNVGYLQVDLHHKIASIALGHHQSMDIHNQTLDQLKWNKVQLPNKHSIPTPFDGLTEKKAKYIIGIYLSSHTYPQFTIDPAEISLSPHSPYYKQTLEKQ